MTSALSENRGFGMAIPTISPYPLPVAEDLPEEQVQWQVDPARAVLLVHDMQQYFVDFFPPGEAPIAGMVDNIAAIRASSMRQGVPVVYTAQPGDMTTEQRGLLRDFWGPGMDARPEHRKIVAELTPDPRDVVLTKWRYSAFTRTDLAGLMRDHGRDQLIICGIYAHVGCLMTAADAFAQDIQPFLVADAIADFSLAEHLSALDYAARRCAAIPTTATVLTQMGATSAYVQ